MSLFVMTVCLVVYIAQEGRYNGLASWLFRLASAKASFHGDNYVFDPDIQGVYRYGWFRRVEKMLRAYGHPSNFCASFCRYQGDLFETVKDISLGGLRSLPYRSIYLAQGRKRAAFGRYCGEKDAWGWQSRSSSAFFSLCPLWIGGRCVNHRFDI